MGKEIGMGKVDKEEDWKTGRLEKRKEGERIVEKEKENVIRYGIVCVRVV